MPPALTCIDSQYLSSGTLANSIGMLDVTLSEGRMSFRRSLLPFSASACLATASRRERPFTRHVFDPFFTTRRQTPFRVTHFQDDPDCFARLAPPLVTGLDAAQNGRQSGDEGEEVGWKTRPALVGFFHGWRSPRQRSQSLGPAARRCRRAHMHAHTRAWPSRRSAQNEPYTFHPPALLWSKRWWGVSTIRRSPIQLTAKLGGGAQWNLR
jgi:hypothetical protein